MLVENTSGRTDCESALSLIDALRVLVNVTFRLLYFRGRESVQRPLECAEAVRVCRGRESV